MSLITDATIVGTVADEDHEFLTSPAPEAVDSRQQSFGHVGNAGTDQAGGNKFYCSDLYLAAFNYFQRYDVLEWLRSHNFSRITDAVLVIEDENDESPFIYRIKNGEVFSVEAGDE